MSSPPSNKTSDSRGFRTPVALRYAPWTGEGHPRHRNRVGHGCQAKPNKQKHNNRFPERHWSPQAVTIGRTPFATRGGEEALLSLLALLPCRRLRWSSRDLLAALTEPPARACGLGKPRWCACFRGWRRAPGRAGRVDRRFGRARLRLGQIGRLVGRWLVVGRSHAEASVGHLRRGV